MTKRIELCGPRGRGVVTLVDESDYPQASKYKWYLSNFGYAYRGQWDAQSKKRKSIFLHREILRPDPGLEVDHINRNRLDNRRDNLRPADRFIQNQNVGPRKDSTTGFKGIYKIITRQGEERWRAELVYYGKGYRAGQHKSPIEAALAYNAKARELMGEMAFQNPIPQS